MAVPRARLAVSFAVVSSRQSIGFVHGSGVPVVIPWPRPRRMPRLPQPRLFQSLPTCVTGAIQPKPTAISAIMTAEKAPP